MTAVGTRRRTAALVAVGLVAVAAVAVVLTLLLTGETDADAVKSKPGTPVAISADDLREFARSADGLVYWAGELPGSELELTRTSRNEVFVRYLSGDAKVGDSRPAFATVSTYPYERAYEVTTKSAKGKGMLSRNAPGGGIAVWSRSRPTSVYVAYPGGDRLVEVFDPDAKRARELVFSGQLSPVE
ncbi:MAG TPA: hypothetical protein VFD31_01495 [Thermoleophilaceae bacterium]|nr:hypothetical protein [Thermoleophilaceae bacterium]